MPPVGSSGVGEAPEKRGGAASHSRHMKHDRRLKAIFDELVEIKACTAEGKLLCRWDGHKWVA
jgi:hypothetical protein